jgi:multiple sugar transport system substrate-binding protein
MAILLTLLPTTATAIAQTQISVAFWGSNEEAAAIELMIDAFEEANPDISVERIWVQSDYEEKVLTMIAGGTPPDVIQISHTSMPGFADQFIPVTIDEDAYSSSLFIEALTFEGELKAIPFVAKPKVMGINVSVFEEQGIELPSLEEPMTPEEFQELAIQLTHGEDEDRTFGSAPLWFTGWLFAFGNTFYNEDGTEVVIGNPEAMEAAQFVIDSAYVHHYAPTPVEAEGQSMFDWFLAGRVAMYPDFGPWYLPLVKEAEDIEWEFVPVPGLGEPLEINGFGISRDSFEPEAAERFALFMSQDETAQTILGTSEAAVGVPVIAAGADAFIESVPDKNLAAFVRAASNSPVPVGHRMDAQIQSEFYTEIEARTALGIGDEDPAVVFPEVEARLNELFED